jgi:hypothetical protein
LLGQFLPSSGWMNNTCQQKNGQSAIHYDPALVCVV